MGGLANLDACVCVCVEVRMCDMGVEQVSDCVCGVSPLYEVAPCLECIPTFLLHTDYGSDQITSVNEDQQMTIILIKEMFVTM